MTLAGDVATADGASAQLRMKGPMDDSVAIDRASDVSSAVASSATPPQAKVGAAQTTIYGLGAIVDATTSVFLNTYLYFYLTAVCGMEGWMAGLALALPLALDAMVDPLVGSLSDNLQSRFGRRRPFMLAAILPIGVSLGLLFSVPVGLTGWGLFVGDRPGGVAADGPGSPARRPRHLAPMSSGSRLPCASVFRCSTFPMRRWARN